MFLCEHSVAANLILPLPKPSLVDNEKKILTQKKGIYPAKKPEIKKEISTYD